MCDRRGRGTSEKGASPGRLEQSHGSSRAEGLARKEAGSPSAFAALTREELLSALTAFAKNWLAHDGCWFLAVEERDGMDVAIELDARAWERFAAVEARRILETFGIPPHGGLQALARALSLRMYALVNEQHLEWLREGRSLRLTMDGCRVQQARARKGLPPFPCRPVGEVEFRTFAGTVDPRIVTRCLRCPPDLNAGGGCTWEFTLEESGVGGPRR